MLSKQTGTGSSSYPAVRIYGNSPYRVAVLHGGPGAPGCMAPVARELSKAMGVAEPLQSKDSLQGQIEELEEQLRIYANEPIVLIGSSWGAALALFAAARKSLKFSKLILIGSAVFDRQSSRMIEKIRISRLTDEQKIQFGIIKLKLANADSSEKEELVKQWGEVFDGTDNFDPIRAESDVIEIQYDLFERVWTDFVALRDEPGRLKNEFSKIDIPVTVIHGDYDPHPIKGIRPFLMSCIEDIRFLILPKCGHYPWKERQAREKFYEIVRSEIDIS